MIAYRIRTPSSMIANLTLAYASLGGQFNNLADSARRLARAFADAFPTPRSTWALGRGIGGHGLTKRLRKKRVKAGRHETHAEYLRVIEGRP